MLESIGNYTVEFFVSLFMNMLLGLIYILRNILALVVPAIWIYAIVLYYSVKDKKAFSTAFKFLFYYFVLVIWEGLLL